MRALFSRVIFYDKQKRQALNLLCGMPRYKTGCVDIRPLLIRQTHLQALLPPALSTDFTLEIESGGPAMNSSAPGTSSWSYSLRANFYALTPAETYYEVVWQVPNMVSKVGTDTNSRAKRERVLGVPAPPPLFFLIK